MSAASFKSFVILGAMRTGSNFLERSLAQHPDVNSFGELFNPDFFGREGEETALGFTLADREADPLRVLREMRRSSAGIAGFRLFDGHDARVMRAVLEDQGCAKIILSRPALESYLSLKIAQTTGQWILGNAASRKGAKTQFEADAFESYRAKTRGFYENTVRALQHLGQTPFHVSYAQLGDIDVLNGALRFLGLSGTLDAPDKSLKRQNPGPAQEKVSNPDALAPYLEGLDQGATSARAPQLKRFVTSTSRRMLFAPVAGGPNAEVIRWMKPVESRHSQKSLKAFQDAHPEYLSFSVVSDPLARAYRAFAARIVADGEGSFPRIRRRLARFHDVRLPEDQSIAAWSTGFLGFLKFLERNLAGQTGIRVDDDWALQVDLIAAISAQQPVMKLIREAQLQQEFASIEIANGSCGAPALESVATDEIRALCRKIYRQDYRKLGLV